MILLWHGKMGAQCTIGLRQTVSTDVWLIDDGRKSVLGGVGWRKNALPADYVQKPTSQRGMGTVFGIQKPMCKRNAFPFAAAAELH